jgi:hypothetical protein
MGIAVGFPSADTNTPTYGAGVITNPKFLPMIMTTEIYYNNNSSGAQTNINTTVPPDHVNALVNSTNMVNIATVSGSGFLHDIITPNSDAGGSAVATVIIVVDGVSYMIDTESALPTGNRLYIGAASDYDTFGRITAKVGKYGRAFDLKIPPISEIGGKALARLWFEYSLSVSVRMSAVPQLSGSFGQHAMLRFSRV